MIDRNIGIKDDHVHLMCWKKYQLYQIMENSLLVIRMFKIKKYID